MRAFLFGFLGFFVAALLYAVVSSQYSDYRAASQTSGWAVGSHDTRAVIAANALRDKSLALAGVGVPPPSFPGFRSEQKPDHSEVTENGIILMQGGADGQLIVLIPSLERGKVSWRCLGGSAKSVSLPSCRSAANFDFGTSDQRT